MLRNLRRHWERFGRRDPFWAALTWKDKSEGRWSADEFFRDGEVVVANLFDRAAALGIEIPRERALDFGCGPGRLTQAIAARSFGVVDGVDIARSMVETARRFNRHGDRCRYHVNQTADLRCFEDAAFTFVCSLLVLQHMRPAIARGYVREFMRVLAPSGAAVFQVPGHDGSESPPSAPARQAAPHWPLDPSACRARIRPAAASLSGRAGSRVPLQVEVENAGDQTWPSIGQSDGGLRVWLGGHWVAPADPDYYQHDVVRSPLRHDLAPGERMTLDFWVTLPEENGDYLFELDMVQEAICWFRQQGSETAAVPCRVEGGRPPEPGARPSPRVPRGRPPAAEAGNAPLARLRRRLGFAKRWIRNRLVVCEPVMEMHGLSPADVRELVTAAGGRLVWVDREVQAHGRQDYHYWIVKA